MLLSKHKTLSTDFRLFVRNEEDRKYYIDLIAESKPTHILYVESELDNPSDMFKDCRGNLNWTNFARNNKNDIRFR